MSVHLLSKLKKVKGPLYSQCFVCPFWATVKTWQYNMANSLCRYKRDIKFLISGDCENIIMGIIFHFCHIQRIDPSKHYTLDPTTIF